MSRLTVAWVTAKPRAVRRSTRSPWLPIACWSTSSRMARWRSALEPPETAGAPRLDGRAPAATDGARAANPAADAAPDGADAADPAGAAEAAIGRPRIRRRPRRTGSG